MCARWHRALRLARYTALGQVPRFGVASEVAASRRRKSQKNQSVVVVALQIQEKFPKGWGEGEPR